MKACRNYSGRKIGKIGKRQMKDKEERERNEKERGVNKLRYDRSIHNYYFTLSYHTPNYLILPSI